MSLSQRASFVESMRQPRTDIGAYNGADPDACALKVPDGQPNASACNMAKTPGTIPSSTTDGPMTYPGFGTGIDGVVFEANHGRLLKGNRAEARVY